MQDRRYWSFDQRHPKDLGNHGPRYYVERWFDRVDDAITAARSTWTYYRISRNASPCRRPGSYAISSTRSPRESRVVISNRRPERSASRVA